ncbi:Multidrug resistance-associated protein 1 [Halotydeus destructor]|nr:Multidrug resistance-associated protein 1 [Halotydeus destructor]
MISKDTFIRMMMYPLVLAMFLLIQMSDIPGEYYQESFYDRASALSKFTYYWMLPIISSLKQKTPITSTDYLIDAVDINSCEELHKRFKKNWSRREKDALLWPLYQTFRRDVALIFLGKAVQIVATLCIPIFGDLFLSWLTNPDQYTWHVYFYVAMIFVGRFSLVINFFRTGNIAQRFSLEIRTLLTSMIHQKTLKMSPLAKAKYTSGQLSNLAFTDPQRISNVFQYLPELFNIPVTTGCCLYLLWGQLGSATITAIILLVSVVPLTVFAKNKFQALQSKLVKAKDGRAKLISEMLTSIRAIKLYAWEKPLAENVTQKRDEEISTIRKQIFSLCLTDLCTNCAGILVSNATFITFCLVLNGSNVARKRLISFFDEDDDFRIDEPVRDRNFAVSVNDCSFSWAKNGSRTLKDINVNIQTGSLTAIIGQVGSGKSSLISAILGDMCSLSGFSKVSGDLALVPQTSWIQNATIKKNITFTSEFEVNKYERVLSACALEDDLKILPAGDETEIGEKGINLSGGQKQRVSLARAVYSDRDLYFLDDTLSAVDANVGNHLFEQVIGRDGLLKNKTRVLVTHKLAVLPFVDDIIIMKDGRIDFQGSYENLIRQRPNYTEVVAMQDGDEMGIELGLPEMKSKKKGNEEAGVRGRLVRTEQMNSKSVMWKVFFEYLTSVKWTKLLSFTLTFAARVTFAVLASLWLGEWASDSESRFRRRDLSLRNIRLSIFTSLGVLQAVCSLILTYLLYVIAADASKTLHSQMLARILRAPMSFFDTTPTGRILNRFTSDVYSNDSTLRVCLRGLSLVLVAGVSSAILVVLKTPLAIIAIVAIVILNSLSQRKYLQTSRQLQRIESTTRSFAFSQLSETISGSTMIRAYDAVEIFDNTCDEKLNSNNVASYCRTITRNWMKAIGGFLSALFVLFSLGLVLVAELNASTAGIIFGASSAITAAIVQGYEQYAQLESCLVAVERCQEYRSTPVEEDEESTSEPYQGWPEEGNVTFESYSTRYRDGLDMVLNNVNLKINGGQKVGIVGRTGAGKSSISLALFRIIEAVEGKIVIDSINCRALKLADLRSRMCIIPQDPVLFIGSLRYNLDPFNRNTEQEIWRALEIANLKDFVGQLNGGLYHEISEGGENISVGQRQLVCLARAVLRKSKILVLDEATAAIDNETDDQIQKTIRTEFADCTILTIAHRLNTILDYDKILVMDKGSVAEYDEPSVLLKRSDSLFHKLAKDAGLL